MTFSFIEFRCSHAKLVFHKVIIEFIIIAKKCSYKPF